MGTRIRAARTGRGWSQQQLADRAGISLRFVGQVESGGANLSIARLAELAAALDVSLVGLLAGLGPVRDVADQLAAHARELDPTGQAELLGELVPRVEKVALVGLRGAGKSTVGALAAAELGCPFVEVDALVRRQMGLSLADLFEIHGPEGYRRASRDVLRQCLVEPGLAVLEVGGSVVLDVEAWQLLTAHARVVWLRASAEAHLDRVAAQGDTRPMEGYDDALRRLHEILAERAPLYERAHVAVDTVSAGILGSTKAVVQAARAIG